MERFIAIERAFSDGADDPDVRVVWSSSNREDCVRCIKGDIVSGEKLKGYFDDGEEPTLESIMEEYGFEIHPDAQLVAKFTDGHYDEHEYYIVKEEIVELGA